MARARSVCVLACVLALVALGCAPKWPELPATPATEWGFSGERAMQHMTELVSLGPG